MGEKVAVIGGTGFLGSNLVLQLLEEGYAPVVVARTPAKLARVLPGVNVEVRPGDITEPDSLGPALAGCSVVHSVAALLNQVFTASTPCLEEAVIRTNVEGTMNVLRTARESGVRRVVIASTCSTRYQPGGSLADEESPPTDLRLASDAYVRSKLRAEAAAIDYARETGLDVVNILPGGLIGPGDWGPSPLQAWVVDHLNGKITPSIEGAFPVVDVRDVARAHVAAMELETPGRVYLMVERTISTREWAAMVTRVAGVPGPDYFLPPSVALTIALAVEGLARLRRTAPLFTRNAVRHVAQGQQYDCSRVQHELGIAFTPVETSLRDAVTWFAENGFVPDPERIKLAAKGRATPESGT